MSIITLQVVSVHKRILKYFQQKHLKRSDKSRGFHINFLRRSMEAAESKESERDDSKLLLVHNNAMSSYGANNHAATVDTPSRNHRFRLWTVTCSCMVAIQTWFIYGYSIGYTAPVLNDLGDVNSTYTSLREASYQDTFSVSTTT